MAKISYRDSGVDIDAGNKFVELLKPIVRTTYTKGFSDDIGSFSGLFAMPKGLKDPYLVSAADGVGTKLKIAIMTGRFDTIGIDLVAMNVNDLITCGAKPLFFLDYLAISNINPQQASSIVRGIAKGCRQSGCVLLGGETAEMPDLYKKGDFDLAGFVVGVVEKKKIISPKRVRSGDVVIGLASSGLHSNGYSLARNLFLKKLQYKLNDTPKPLRRSLGAELLTPTKIYVNSVLSLLDKYDIKAIAHITGGGFVDNIPRALPENVKVVINKKSWTKPPIYKLIEHTGLVDEVELYRTFNSGIGMVLIVSVDKVHEIMDELKRLSEKAFIIGEVKARAEKEHQVELFD